MAFPLILTAKNPTWVQEFEKAGYTTAHFGKSHLGSPLRMMGFTVGECLDGKFPEGKEPLERIKVREESLKDGGDGHQDRTKNRSIQRRMSIIWICRSLTKG